jgi:hypothetical protein
MGVPAGVATIRSPTATGKYREKYLELRIDIKPPT